MNIDWMDYKNKDHILAWFLVEAMSAADITRFGDFDSSKLEVELKVNGIEVPIVEPMEHLQQQLKEIEEGGRKAGYEQARDDLRDKIDALLDVDA